MATDHVLDRLSPFLDDELDPVGSREVAEHLESCPECSAALARQRTLSEGVKRDLAYHRAPDLLRQRVTREVHARGRSHARGWAMPRWQWLSAAAAVIAVAGGAWVAILLPRQRADEATTREAVSSHIRSLMASHLMDVASTDQHTVKPWFSGRLDFSPPVMDFAAQGYPLVGGRLDYLQGHPVAALVYQHRRHVINVFVWPMAGGREGMAPAMTERGFHVIHGVRGGMACWVVSDLNAEELATFARMVVVPSGNR